MHSAKKYYDTATKKIYKKDKQYKIIFMGIWKN